ncbi:MAG: glycosyltransferase family 2 protein, partial [Planctomycetota bacterium]
MHNSRGSIASCLRAIHEQRSLDSSKPEIIVVDDGSSDGSAAEAKGLCDRLIRLDKNSGAAVARNRGAAEASAELLVFVDSDVILLPDALGKVRELFVRRPDTDAAVGRYTETPARAGLVNAYHNSFTRFHHDLSPEEIDWFWGALGAVKR